MAKQTNKACFLGCGWHDLLPLPPFFLTELTCVVSHGIRVQEYEEGGALLSHEMRLTHISVSVGRWPHQGSGEGAAAARQAPQAAALCAVEGESGRPQVGPLPPGADRHAVREMCRRAGPVMSAAGWFEDRACAFVQFTHEAVCSRRFCLGFKLSSAVSLLCIFCFIPDKECFLGETQQLCVCLI